MKTLAEEAKEAVESGKVNIIPESGLRFTLIG